MIEIKKLTLQRGLKVLLDKADAVINPGQRVGLIGKNGTGKSSLFALIKGEITQDGGEILIPKTWRLASVSQETPDLDISALDYVLQGDAELQAFQTALVQAEAQNDGMKQAEYHAKLEEIDAYTAPARAAKLLNGLGFSQEEHTRPVKSFSGGWRMRLNLAQALICRADLLLLDEPFGALDAKVRKELRTWLRDIHHNLGVTSILVTHDQEEALEVSDEIVVMNHGKIEQTGSAEAIYRKPENAFVTEFLGETDAFEGRIEKGIWHYNGFAWKLDAHYKWQEQTAIGYIRPHEWQLAAENETPMIRAKIEKIHAVGALTHILVKHDKQDVHITLAGSDAARYQIAEGKELKLIPKQVYVFSQNELIEYSI